MVTVSPLLTHTGNIHMWPCEGWNKLPERAKMAVLTIVMIFFLFTHECGGILMHQQTGEESNKRSLHMSVSSHPKQN